MCVILFKSHSTKIDYKTLALARDKNPDGLGVAWRVGGSWSIVKSLKPSDSFLKRIISLTNGKTAIYHFRIATSGGVNINNLHPFHDSNNKIILFHNGIISSLNGIVESESDTALLFRLLSTNNLNKIELLSNLAKKTFSKFIFIEKNKINLFGDFKSYKGLKCSNLLFVPIKPIKKQYSFNDYNYNYNKTNYDYDYELNRLADNCWDCQDKNCDSCETKKQYFNLVASK